MARAGSFVVAAVILALVAAGALLWTDFFEFSQQPRIESMPAPTSAPIAREAQLVKAMTDAAAGGGFSATFTEGDARKWQVAAGNRMERFSLDASGPSFARLTSPAALDKASVSWPELGLSTGLPFEFTKMSNGRKIEIGVVARSAQANGSPELSIVYATQQAGNSGWKSFALQADFELYKFMFEVPKLEDGYTNPPIIAIHSDSAGAGRAVEIIGVYVKLL